MKSCESQRADFYPVKDENKQEHVAVRYDFSCNGTHLEIDGDKMRLTYLYSTEKEAGDMLNSREKEVREYLGAGNGYLDFSSWGITCGEGRTDNQGIMSA